MPIIYPSVRRFPTTPTVRDEGGVIWGCAVTPFEQLEDNEVEVIAPDTPILRCEQCFAYINSLCHIRARMWTCSLCGNINHVPNSSLRIDDPELSSKCVEYVIPLDSDLSANTNLDSIDPSQASSYYLKKHTGKNQPVELGFELPTKDLPPLYMVLIDESSCDFNTIEMITKSIESLVDSLPSESRFGLFTFSDRLGVYDLNTNRHEDRLNGSSEATSEVSSIIKPHVLYIPLGRMIMPNQQEEQLGALPIFDDFTENENEVVSISDVLELDECTCLLNEEGLKSVKRALRAIGDEALRYQSERIVPAQCFGLALGRIFELLLDNPKPNALYGNERLNVAGSKLLCFLSSPCTHGPGCVITQSGGAGGMLSSVFRGSASSASSSTHQACARQGSVEGDAAYDIYEKFGERAALGGVSCDIFAITNKSNLSLGLNLIEPLNRLSGGILRKYDLSYCNLNDDGGSSGSSGSKARSKHHNKYGGLANANFVKLKQDLFKIGQRNVAFRGALRIRTSSEINYRYDEVYGPCCPDPEAHHLDSEEGECEGLFHLPCCDTSQTICFGIDFKKGCDLVNSKKQPVIQIAFAYTGIIEELVPIKPSDKRTARRNKNKTNTQAAGENEPNSGSDSDSDTGSEEDSGNSDNDESVGNKEYGYNSELIIKRKVFDNSRYTVKRYTGRRLRVYTLGIPTCTSVGKYMSSTDLDVQLLFLAHKSCYEVGISGIIDSRILIRDWLVRVCLNAALHLTQTLSKDFIDNLNFVDEDEDSGKSLAVAADNVNIDVLLGPNLLMLAPYVFGLLRGNFLGHNADLNEQHIQQLNGSASGGGGVGGGAAAASSSSGIGASLQTSADAVACAEAEIYELGVDEFRKLCYPELLVVKRLNCLNPDQGTQGRRDECFKEVSLRLSRTFINSLEHKVLLLDTSTNVCVYYPWDTLSSVTPNKTKKKSQKKSQISPAPSSPPSTGSQLKKELPSLSSVPVPPYEVQHGIPGGNIDLSADVQHTTPNTTSAINNEDTLQNQMSKASLTSDGEDDSSADEQDKVEVEFPYPPPADCEVMRAVKHRTNATRATPVTIVCRAGTPEARFFEDGLVEDQGLPASLGGGNYNMFLKDVAKAVLSQAKAVL